MQKIIEPARKLAEEFCQFLNSSYSPFHVVDICTKKLEACGFKQLKETENWELEKGGKYLFSRNKTSLVAFVIGDQYKPSNTGFKIIATHTDSPSLRIAPISKHVSQGFNQCCVETYGGGLWHSWFDRDLVVGGKVIYKTESSELKQTLFTYEKPIMKISTLAPHLDNSKAFAYNKETHLRPIISTEVYDKLLKPSSDDEEKKDDKKNSKKEKGKEKHYSKLLELISKQINVPIEQILDFDLRLSNHQSAAITGINDEFVSSDKMDNLISTFTALSAFCSPDYTPSHEFVDMVFMLDHEEIGSQSAQGAGSPLIKETIQRIFKLLGYDAKCDDYEKVLHRSLVLSADVGHSVNPCYSGKHQENHQIKVNSGVCVAISANQHMATDAVSLSLLRTLADAVNIPLQETIDRQDQSGGCTLGPIIAGQTGIKTVDLGCPELGMHSTSETTGVLDVLYCRNLMLEFLNKYEAIKHTLLDS